VVIPLARVMRLASIVICLIVGASFTLFAVNQTSGAASHQEALLNEGAPAQTAGAGAQGESTTAGVSAGGAAKSSSHESSLRSSIDDAANTLTSPFAGVTSDTSSEWTIHTVKLLLTLAIYGFGLGFLARVLRVGT